MSDAQRELWTIERLRAEADQLEFEMMRDIADDWEASLKAVQESADAKIAVILDQHRRQDMSTLRRRTAMAANDVQHGGDHYKTKAIQPWDFIVSNNIGFLEGNAIKYLCRWRDKGGIQDLEKARHYIDKLIEVEKAKVG